MRKNVLIVALLAVFLVSAAWGQPTYPHHDCNSICDLPCQDRIEQVHFGEAGQLPLNCTNGAPGTGPVANYCDWFWSNKVYTIQTCGNGGINQSQTGCQAGGTLKCRKPDGMLAFPGYDFKCHYNSVRGGMPVQTIDQQMGLCTWPDGTEVVMSCNETGGISFAITF